MSLDSLGNIRLQQHLSNEHAGGHIPKNSIKLKQYISHQQVLYFKLIQLFTDLNIHFKKFSNYHIFWIRRHTSFLKNTLKNMCASSKMNVEQCPRSSKLGLTIT